MDAEAGGDLSGGPVGVPAAQAEDRVTVPSTGAFARPRPVRRRLRLILVGMLVVWLVGAAVDDATHGGAHSVLTHLLGLALAIAVVDRTREGA